MSKDKVLRPELPYYNDEHYPEPTAYHAFSHKKEMEQREYDMCKMSEAILMAKAILKRYGFIVIERIKVKSLKTGRIYE